MIMLYDNCFVALFIEKKLYEKNRIKFITKEITKVRHDVLTIYVVVINIFHYKNIIAYKFL